MKKGNRLFILLFFTGFFLAASPGTAAEAWTKASASFAGSQNWRAGTMSLLSRELNRRGEVKEEWLIEYQNNSDDEEPNWEIIKALKDGAPASEREIAKRSEKETDEDRQPPDDYFEGVDVLPLDLSQIQKVEAVPAGRSAWFEGEKQDVYTFTHTYDSGAVTSGELFIDSDGFPRKLEYEFVNLPFYMKTMKCLFTFIRMGDDAVIKSMRMEGHISAVIFNVHFLNNMEFGSFSREGA